MSYFYENIELDFRKGTLLSSKVPLTAFLQGTSKFIKSGYGMCVRNTPAQSDGGIIGLLSGAESAKFYNDLTQPFSYTYLFVIKKKNRQLFQYGLASTAYNIGIYPSNLQIYSTSTTNYLRVFYPNIPFNKLTCLTITYNGNLKASGITVMVNGVKQTLTVTNDALSTSTFIPNTSYQVTIGNNGGADTNFLESYYFKWENRVSSLEENKSKYLEFLNSKPINKPVLLQPNLSLLKPTELQETGLIAAYNFRPVNGKLPNIAWDNPANGGNARQYDGTIGFGQSNQNGLYFNSPKSIITATSITLTKWSLCMIITKGSKTLQWMISNEWSTAKYDIRISSNQLNVTRTGYAKSGGLVPNTISTFIFISDGLHIYGYLNGQKVLICEDLAELPTVKFQGLFNYFNTFYPSGLFYDFKLYNRALSDQEIKSYHNQFASKVVLQEDFSQYPVGATRFGNWNSNNGWSIGEISDTKLTLPKGSKYVIRNSDRVLRIPSSIVYGTWEFDIITPTTGRCFINFIANSNTTNLQESLYFRSVGGQNVFFRSAAGGADYPLNFTWSLNTRYRIKITREVSGRYKFYIDDKLYLTQIVSNPTSCRWFSIYNTDSAYRLTNLKITQGVTV